MSSNSIHCPECRCCRCGFFCSQCLLMGPLNFRPTFSHSSLSSDLGPQQQQQQRQQQQQLLPPPDVIRTVPFPLPHHSQTTSTFGAPKLPRRGIPPPSTAMATAASSASRRRPRLPSAYFQRSLSPLPLNSGTTSESVGAWTPGDDGSFLLNRRVDSILSSSSFVSLNWVSLLTHSQTSSTSQAPKLPLRGIPPSSTDTATAASSASRRRPWLPFAYFHRNLSLFQLKCAMTSEAILARTLGDFGSFLLNLRKDSILSSSSFVW